MDRPLYGQIGWLILILTTQYHFNFVVIHH